MLRRIGSSLGSYVDRFELEIAGVEIEIEATVQGFSKGNHGSNGEVGVAVEEFRYEGLRYAEFSGKVRPAHAGLVHCGGDLLRKLKDSPFREKILVVLKPFQRLGEPVFSAHLPFLSEILFDHA